MDEKTSIAVLEVKQLSKLYYKDQRMHDSIREEVVEGVKSLFRPRKISAGVDQFWALKDVSFQLEKGDVLGVIGPNGAGKSTLLKILSEVTAPTSGEILYQGELTPILEIGTGFHPDLSGRENVFLNGAVLGMSRSEMEARLPDILAFSGVEDFIDSPVKHYSSGMFLRLAFAIAFHADIDILVLDEVLAVGDAAFQRKSFDRIKELAASGATIILASHTNRQIFELCNKCLWLEGGKTKALGPTKLILEEYLEEVLDDQLRRGNLADAQEGNQRSWPPAPNSTSTKSYSLLEVKVCAANKAVDAPIFTEDRIEIEIKIQKESIDKSMEVGIRLLNLEGLQLILDSYGLRADYQIEKLDKGPYVIRTHIQSDILNKGVYILNIFAGVNGKLENEWPYVLKFRIEPPREEKETTWLNHSILKMPLLWEVSALEK